MITKAQLLSTGAAIRYAEQHGMKASEIEKVTLKVGDGAAAEVDAKVAVHALDELEGSLKAAAQKREESARQAAEKPTWWNRATAAVTSGVNSTTTFLKKNVADPTVSFLEKNLPEVNRAGEALVDATNQTAMSKPEDVMRHGTVSIALKGGKTLDVPVQIVDENTARFLKVTSVVASGAGMVPFFGNFIQGGTGIVCALASGASFMFGDDDLGRALGGMAKKHVTMGLVGFVPGLSVVSAVGAVQDANRLRDGVPLDQLVEAPA